MYAGYMYPFYRSPYYGGYGYPGFGFGYGAVPGFSYGNYNSVNAIGSAISNQSIVNTGSAIGITQISTPTAIW